MPYYHPPNPTAGDRLRDLGQYLRDLACRVRHLAAEAIGETLSRLVKDASDRVLHQVIGNGSDPPVVIRHDPHDPWQDDEDYYESAPEERDSEPTPVRTIGRTVMAGILWGTGWWLRRRRSPWAAAAVAAAAIVASVFASASANSSNELVAAADLLAVHDVFEAGARVLSGP